jgi:UDP-N-acetylmuramyl tripeptide synthase
VSTAGPSQGARRDDAARVRLFDPSAPAQAGSEPRVSAPSGGSAAHGVASVGAKSGQPLAVVDYAHTPDALAQVLQALQPLAHQRGGQLWCVFGCGGDRDPLKRPLMGAVAAQHADKVVVTSDNPRSEKPEAVISQILLGLEGVAGVDVEADRAQAIAQTLKQAGAQDVVLVAGKGHEDYQEIAGVRQPFSDRAEVSKALQARANASGAGVAA